MGDDREAIVVESQGRVLVVTLLDRSILAEAQVKAVRDASRSLIKSEHTRLVFDLSHPEEMTSIVLAVFLNAKKRATTLVRSGSEAASIPRELVRLTTGKPGPSDSSGSLLRSRLFEVFADRSAAIEAMASSRAEDGRVVLCGLHPKLMRIFRVC